MLGTLAGGLAATIVAAGWLGIFNPGSWFLIVCVLLLAVGGCLFAALLTRAPSGSRTVSSSGPSEEIHSGINMAHIPIAGFPGLVFVGGFIYMFWANFPFLRPYVVGIGSIGCVLGMGLIISQRNHRVASDAPLGLSIRAAEQGVEADKAPSRRHNG